MKDITRAGLERYRDLGCPTGHFLTAVLTNDLTETFARGDEENIRDLLEIIQWVYNELPIGSWNSPENVRKWIKLGGLEGLKAQSIRNELSELVEAGAYPDE